MSSRELDLAVDAALDAGAHGARMTGGGFGGSAVALVDEASADAVGDAVRTAFAAARVTAPRVFRAVAQPGRAPGLTRRRVRPRARWWHSRRMSFAPPPRALPARSLRRRHRRGHGLGPAATTHRTTSSSASGGSADYLATGAATGGDYGLYRWSMGSAPAGPSEHFHRSLSESFFVLDGSVRVFDGRAWVDMTRGDFCYVPPGGVHGFRNESGAPASMLILFAPGAPRERYFEGLAERAAMDEKPTADEMAEFYRVHDTFWV